MENDKHTQKNLQKIVGFFEDHQDITYQVFELMPIGICVTNGEGIYTDVNATYCDIYGYTRKELVGENFTKVVPDDYKSHLVELHDKFLEEHFELKGRWKVKNKNGELFEIITNAAYLDGGDNGDQRKMTLVVKANQTDATLKRLQVTLNTLEGIIQKDENFNENSDKHAVSGKVTSILSFADILKETDLSEKQKQWLKIIMDISKDTLKHLSSAEDFEAMESGTYKPEVTNFDFINLVCNQVMDFLDLAQEKDVRVNIIDEDKNHIDPDAQQLIVSGDEFYLEYLYEGLIKNAITSAPTGSHVNITIYEDKQLKVRIHNSSVVSEKMKTRFFDKNAHFGKGQENGLSNHISKLIANVHRGNISFVSEEGRGTSITVEMPILIKVS